MNELNISTGEGNKFPQIRIFLSYHKDAARLESEILTPIHVGRAVARSEDKRALEDIIGDDVGENISDKNPFYCELTAQYWAWKNVRDVTYIGFMHYRRHLVFRSEIEFPQSIWGVHDEEKINRDYQYRMGLYDSVIKKEISGFDIVTVRPWCVKATGSKNNYDHYKSSDKKLHIDDYNKALEILIKKYPQYKQAVVEYNNLEYGYYTNIFVMKKEVFDEYCEFLFSILFALEKELDVSSYNQQEARVFGYISEWLFGIFITYKKANSTLKIKELQRTFVLNVDYKEKDDIHICTACDEGYAQHFGVMLTSLLKNKKSEDIIYVYVLDGGISEASKKRLENLPFYGEKLFVYYIPMNLDKFEIVLSSLKGTHLTLATYFRLLMSILLPNFINKLLYLDVDLIVRTSLLPLYNQSVDGYLMGGVKDVIVAENCRRLNLEKYVNAGVLLVNLAQWRINKIENRFFEYIRKNKDKIVYHDQDVLNVVLQNGIFYLNPLWNAQTASYPGSEEQNEIGKRANIVHFVSDRKPWVEGSNSPFANEYYEYRKISPWGGVKFKLLKRKKTGTLRDFKYYAICVRIFNKLVSRDSKLRIYIKRIIGLG